MNALRTLQAILLELFSRAVTRNHRFIDGVTFCKYSSLVLANHQLMFGAVY